MTSASSNILGGTSPEQFLLQYWQREPLLVRNALPDFSSPLSADELAGLALDTDVESRLVFEQGESGPWEVRHGPFQESDFANLPEQAWTLLVQAIDLWVPAAKSILHHFDFLPAWRLDDIMASYAVAGGSVGPHFDHYDVFLLQVEGQRLWKIGDACTDQTPLVAGTDLQIVENFKARQEWLLNPGDMLYLPPLLSHWGVARSDCLTFSVGFRAPTLADMLGDLAIEILAQGNDKYYTDPELNPSMASEEIHPAFIEQAKKLLREALNDDALIEDWFARFMTAAKYPELEQRTEEQRHASVRGQRYNNGDLES